MRKSEGVPKPETHVSKKSAVGTRPHGQAGPGPFGKQVDTRRILKVFRPMGPSGMACFVLLKAEAKGKKTSPL